MDLVNKLLLGTTALLSSLTFNANAQGVVTPKEKIYDVVNQPNLHILEGKDSLAYYGSGSYDGKTITLAGAEALRNGEVNSRLDVLGVGLETLSSNATAREAAAQKIENFVNGTESYLPAHTGNPLMPGQEKVNWTELFQINIDKTDTVRETTAIWECGQFSRNSLANTFGITNFENYVNYPVYENTRGEFANINTLRVDAYTDGDVAHVCNGMFEGGLSTIDFDNYYIFDSFKRDYLDIQPGGLQLRKGPIVFTKFVYNENFLGQEGFRDATLMRFNMDENYNVTLEGVAPEILRVNPHAVDLTLSGLENKEFNYEENLDYGDLGEVNYLTNVDTENVLNTKGPFGGADLTGQNVANVSYEMSEQEPLYEDERGQYNYTVRRKGLVELVQNTTMGGSFYSQPIKSDSIFQTITVRDTEVPGIVRNKESTTVDEGSFTQAEDYVDYTVTDNAKVKSINYTTTLESSNDLQDVYRVDVSAEDVTGNINPGTGLESYVYVEKPTAVDEPVEKFKFSLYPNPTQDDLMINYNSMNGGKASIEIYSRDGRLVDHDTPYLAPGNNELKLDLDNVKPGLYILNFTENGKTKTGKFIKN